MDTLTAANGCDSIISTNLIVLNHSNHSQIFNICPGENVTVGSSSYSAAGTYYDTLINDAGCDSAVTTIIVTLPVDSTAQTFEICPGESVLVGTSTYSSQGTYIDILAGANGCDSTIVTTIIEVAESFVFQSFQLCPDENITVGSSVYGSTGTYTDILTGSNGCDSTITTIITALPVSVTDLNFELCPGQSVVVGSSTYSAPGIFTDSLVAINGCDSIVTTNISLASPTIDSTDITICIGDSLFAGGGYQSSPGTYYDTFTTVAGCDSIIITVLDISNNYVVTRFIQLCNGESIFAGGAIQTGTGIYYDTTVAQSGCDSVVITDLVVSPHTSFGQNIEICNGETFTVGSSTYDSSGTYTDILINANGCDSTVTTNLTVLPDTTISQAFDICPGESVTVGSSNYTTSGSYTDVLTASNGCDSVVITTVTRLTESSFTQSFNICPGENVNVGSSVYDSPGSYTDVLIGINGCDSNITTNVAFLPVSNINLTPTICVGDSFIVGSSAYFFSGSYLDTLTKTNGCDSIISTDLLVLSPSFDTLTIVLCPGESITVGSSTYSTQGSYTDIISAVNGCDSTITSIISLFPESADTLNFNICPGESVNVGTSTYSSTGTYTDVLTAINGCDSTITTNVTLLQNKFTSLTLNICPGESVTVGSSTYDSSGTYIDFLSTATGCDSTITTQLSVSPTFTFTRSITICIGDSLFAGGDYQSTPGTYVDTFLTFDGCDSVIMTELDVSSAYIIPNPVNICDGESYFAGGSSQTDTGTYQDTLQAQNGCDSILVTELTVLPHSTSTNDVEICQGDSYTIGNSTYTVSGSFKDTITSANGCDSIVTTNLTVISAITTNLEEHLCPGESFTVGNSTYSSAGTYVNTLIASGGCDSIITTEIEMLQESFVTLTFPICPGENVTVGGTQYSSEGTYTNILTGSNSCDSTITINISFLSQDTTTLSPIICLGESFTVGSSVYSSSGIYTDILTANNGCDSTVITNLTVHQNSANILSFALCPGESVSVGSSNYSLPGIYRDTLNNVNGCDSVITSSISVLGVSADTLNFNICPGESITVGNSTYSSSGTYTDVLTAANGCDSTITTNVTLLQDKFTSLALNICPGESVTIGSSIYDSNGTYIDILSSARGCDSTITTQLSVNATYTFTRPITICIGDSLFVGGDYQGMPGTYIDSLVTVDGCDSVITTELDVSSAYIVTNPERICEGESYFAGGDFQTESGTYRDTTTAQNGCHSILITDLIVLPIVTDTIAAEVCDGESFVVGNSAYTSTGIYTDILTGPNGCDSIVVTNLTVLQNSTTVLEFNICPGENVAVGNSTYSSAGSYIDVLTAANGCDSTINTTISILPDTSVTRDLEICLGETVTIGSSTYSNEGTYSDTLVAANSCDSIIITNLVVHPTVDTALNFEVCPGESITVGTSTYNADGTYFDTLSTAAGCDSIITSIVHIHHSYVDTLDITICAGDSLFAEGNYQSSPGIYMDSLFTVNGCDSVIITLLDTSSAYIAILNIEICDGESHFAEGAPQSSSGTYFDTSQALNGCDSIVVTNLTVIPDNLVSVSVEICEGESFSVGNSTYTNSGTYYDTLIANSSCDSIVTTHLTVNLVADTTLSFEICPGESVLVGTSTYSTPGTYFDTLIATIGCDSVITSVIVVNPTYLDTLTFIICAGDSFFVGGEYQDTPGVYMDSLSTSNGCDSIIITMLDTSNAYVTHIYDEICHGDSLFIGGEYQTSAGIYYDTTNTQNGCDSILATNLSFRSLTIDTLDVIICEDESFTVGSSTYTSPGRYFDTLTVIAGCDSVIITNLTVFRAMSTTLEVDLCPGESITIGPSTYDSSGTYFNAFTTVYGCDSTIITIVSTYNNYSISRQETICVGDSFFAGGVYQTTPGVYVDSFNTVIGCDSVVTTFLDTYAVYSTTSFVEICQGESHYSGGGWQTSTGTYVDSALTLDGCDSIMITELKVHPLPSSMFNVNLCLGEHNRCWNFYL